MANVFIGRCHCKNVEIEFETEKVPIELGVRACTCSFCSKHGARNTSDPQGRVQITIRDCAQLNRYRFGLKTADFLICKECGIYLGAVYANGNVNYATININTLEISEAFSQTPTLVNYDRETESERRSRRQANWTPATILNLKSKI